MRSSENEELLNAVKDILEALPNRFDLKTVNETHPTSNSVNLVLLQEIQQYNRLLSCIRTTSMQVLDAIQGIQALTICCLEKDCRKCFRHIHCQYFRPWPPLR